MNGLAFPKKIFFCSVGHFSAELSVPDPRNGLCGPFVSVGVVYVVLRTGPGNRVFAGLRFCEGGAEMKKKKLWLRILAAVLAFGLLWIVASMTLSFTGDPISAAMSHAFL